MGGRLQKSFKKYLQDLSIAYRIRLSVAPVAQLDRVPGYEPGGRGFESYPAHQVFCREPLGSFFVAFFPSSYSIFYGIHRMLIYCQEKNI